MNEFSIDKPQNFGPPRWMLSFADLMSVILTFFVLLFSLSVPPSSKVDQDNKLTGNSEAAFSVKHAKSFNGVQAAVTDKDLSTNYLADILKNRMATYPELAKAKLEQTENDNLTISIAANEFSDEYAANMALVLKPLTNKVAIYTAALDQSKAVVDKMQQKGLDRNISYFESHDIPGRIDIVIYP